MVRRNRMKESDVATMNQTSFQVGSRYGEAIDEPEGRVGVTDTAVIRKARASPRRRVAKVKHTRTGTVTLVDKTGAPSRYPRG